MGNYPSKNLAFRFFLHTNYIFILNSQSFDFSSHGNNFTRQINEPTPFQGYFCQVFWVTWIRFSTESQKVSQYFGRGQPHIQLNRYIQLLSYMTNGLSIFFK